MTIIIINNQGAVATKTPAISPASKTPAQPFFAKVHAIEIKENTRFITKELDITRSKNQKE